MTHKVLMLFGYLFLWLLLYTCGYTVLTYFSLFVHGTVNDDFQSGFCSAYCFFLAYRLMRKHEQKGKQNE